MCLHDCRKDKQIAWGCSSRTSITRTIVVHVLTVVAQWAVLLDERQELRRLHAGMGLKELISRGVAPQLILLLVYGHVFHRLTETYGIKTVTNERLHRLQTIVMLCIDAAIFPAWRSLVSKC